jgi:crossover junction endodeoxyribonuclease RuvC
VPDVVIMGVDAALFATGIGILKVNGDSFETIHTELVKTSDRQGLPVRLEKIFNSVCECIKKYSPDLLALEDIFYSKNLKIALSLGQARGVVMLACAMHKVKLVEYSAREIKQAVTGNGGASKEQVAYMVKNLLRIEGDFKTFDISDSLAAALCAGFKMNDLVFQ